MLTNYQNKINLVTPSTWFCFPSHNRLPLEERLGKSYSATVWHNALGYSSSVMTQLIWNSAKDVAWLQTFKASEDVPTRAARPAVSEFAVTVQSQKSHKLHTWTHNNCRHTPVSLKFKAGVKPLSKTYQGSFYYLPSFRRSLSFYHKSHLHFSWGFNLKRSLPAVWRRECHSLSHSVASHSTCGTGICRLEK